MSQIGLTPPPLLLDISDFFEFQTHLKNADPPLGSISDTFEYENILKGLVRHIYIEKGQIKCFISSFLGWGLKVTYNLDFFEKFRPPPHRFSKVRI